MFKIRGLKKRWFLNTVGVVCTLGLACVMVITAVFAGYYYTSMESDLYYRARTTTAFFADYLNQDYYEYCQSCITYAQSYADDGRLKVQFIGADGRIIASSDNEWTGAFLETTDITDAINTRTAMPYMGKDPHTGERIMAVSSPMIYSNGDVIGVLRYIASMRIVDSRILCAFVIAFLGLILVAVIVFYFSNCYIRAILVPLEEIADKAKRISNGSYGIQINGKYDDEIGELVSAINEMSFKINQNEKMQTEFISSLSHELRTPLTSITGWIETLLNSEELDKETSKGIKIISGETRRLTEMVVELLDFTRIRGERMTLNMEPTDIRDVFEETVYMYGGRLPQDGIKLVYLDNDEDIPEISCDPNRLRQVFLNILDNAAKHGGEGKRIEASLRNGEDSVVIQIRDYGPGIPEDELPLVKHKFFKGSSKARGTGIGLAVCDEIVQMHGGALMLENAEGGGTLVTVCLPVN